VYFVKLELLLFDVLQNTRLFYNIRCTVQSSTFIVAFLWIVIRVVCIHNLLQQVQFGNIVQCWLYFVVLIKPQFIIFFIIFVKFWLVDYSVYDSWEISLQLQSFVCLFSCHVSVMFTLSWLFVDSASRLLSCIRVLTVPLNTS